MWIKICGNTTLDDAYRAASLGAHAVGFIFARSPRQITAEEAAAITPRLPSTVERVGVFTDSSADEIARVVHTAELSGIQLHGPIDRHRIDQLVQLLPGIPIIPVVQWEVGDTEAALSHVADQLQHINNSGTFRRILIDAKAGTASGGTGVAFDWTAARPVFQKLLNQGFEPILAGGLRPENIAEAIRLVQPFGVDVSSGVELSPGRKDLAAVTAFIANARGTTGSQAGANAFQIGRGGLDLTT